MKIRSLLFTATCLAMPLAAPLVAHAQPVTGPYFTLQGGTSFLSTTKLTSPFGEVKLGWHPDYALESGIGYGFGNGLRVEVDGNFYRNTAYRAENNIGFSGRITGGENKYGPMFNVLYDIPVNFPVTPYVGGGIGVQWVKYNSDIGRSIGGTTSSFAYDLIGGVSYALPMPGLALTAEYRFMQLTGSRGFVSGGVPVSAGQDTSHTLLVGLRYALETPAPAAPVAPAPAPAPMAAPAPAPARTFLVFFDWDKADLTPRATQIISEAASDSKTANVTTLQVSGYTDTSGTADYNMGLSERRAKAVAGQLESDGVPASEIEIQAYGETHLLVPTGPGVREPQNRRVEIVLQ